MTTLGLNPDIRSKDIGWDQLSPYPGACRPDLTFSVCLRRALVRCGAFAGPRHRWWSLVVTCPDGSVIVRYDVINDILGYR
jgi:hypothetical protein